MGAFGAIIGVIIGIAICASGFYLAGTNAVAFFDAIFVESAGGAVWAVVWFVVGLFLIGIGFWAIFALGAILGAI